MRYINRHFTYLLTYFLTLNELEFLISLRDLPPHTGIARGLIWHQ